MKGSFKAMFLICLLVLVGCGKEIPNDIIQPDEMEKMLYDYQIVTAMNDQIPYSEQYKKELLRQDLFRKHHITEAEFDFSLVWYTKHAIILGEIYGRISEKLEKEHEEVQARLTNRTNEIITSQPGDTVNIWRGEPLYLLTDNNIHNRIDFTIPRDSNFHVKDEFAWNFDVIFLPEHTKKVTVGLSAIYQNDSVVGKTMDLYKTGSYQIYLSCDSAYAVKELNGFVHMHAGKEKKNGFILNHVNLMRYHTVVDSSLLKTDRPELLPKDSILLKSKKVQ